MPITRFSFDEFQGLKLNEITFTDFNLLVGPSGAGKTQILQAIRKAIQAGTTEAVSLNGCEWLMEVSVDGEKYVWSARTNLIGYPPSNEDEIDKWLDEQEPGFTQEMIWRGSKVIVERDWRSFSFDGKALPKLKTTESAISLLRQESVLAPLYRTLSGFIFSEASNWASAIKIEASRLGIAPFDREVVNQIRKRYPSLNELREARGVHLLVKAYILQEDHPQEFSRIKKAYTDIFPTVLALQLMPEDRGLFATEDETEFKEWLSVGIEEKGALDWVTNERISAGMLRTLVHLFELALAPPGTAIIIDEVENSMGGNCLPQMTEHFLRHADLQFILTSHHPYIINNIPWRYWKLVTRQGSEITVKDATAIPALNTASSLERFTQLLNLEEYEEAIR